MHALGIQLKFNDHEQVYMYQLLEKQRVQNRFSSYEVYMGHFYYNVNATVSFGNRIQISITGLTD